MVSRRRRRRRRRKYVRTAQSCATPGVCVAVLQQAARCPSCLLFLLVVGVCPKDVGSGVFVAASFHSVAVEFADVCFQVQCQASAKATKQLGRVERR